MRWLVIATMLTVMLVLTVGHGGAADDSKVKSATGQVETGAKQLGNGRIGEGVEQTAKGIGKTAVEGAKLSGQKIEESAKAAAPQTRGAGEKVRDGAVAFGRSVKAFFQGMFN